MHIRIPVKIEAKQWLPFARLPHVENIMGEVQPANAQTHIGISHDISSLYQPPKKPKLTCIGARVLIGDKLFELAPHDYVIYNIDTGTPIQVINESLFDSNYISTDKFELCSDCAAKVKALASNSGETFKSLDEYIKLLEQGKYFTIMGKKITTVEELNALRAELAAKQN